MVLLARSANTAAWLLWMWAGTHTFTRSSPLLTSDLPTTRPPTLAHSCSAFRIRSSKPNGFVNYVSSLSLSSYCQRSRRFFSSSTAPDHLIRPLCTSCFSPIDSTSIKPQRESLSFNIVWQFKSLPPEFQLYREEKKKTFHIYRTQICKRFQLVKISCGVDFATLKGISSCVVLRISCMFMSPVYVCSSRSCTSRRDTCIPANVSFCGFPWWFLSPPHTHTSVFKLHQLLGMNASPGEKMRLLLHRTDINALLSLPFHLFLCFFSPQVKLKFWYCSRFELHFPKEETCLFFYTCTTWQSTTCSRSQICFTCSPWDG